ncbi:MAG: hypothetical protein KGI50_01335 [Patescibacteria group bacterium]|nr:hypothetical protein [Patescibacteria group bacterium]MDE2438007.1 hypothetical protein [Patescibacteria group bacterium]
MTEESTAPKKPLSELLQLKAQYELQSTILFRTAIVSQLLGKEGLGFVGIDGKEYPVPSYEEVKAMVDRQEDILTKKAEQGFVKLLLVPFGMRLGVLIEKYKQALLTHLREGALFATKKSSDEPNEPIELDGAKPVWVWDGFVDADANNLLLYYPHQFSAKEHGGKTKLQLLAEGKAWNVLLVEYLPNIPRAGKGLVVGERHQLEAGKSPRDYLTALSADSWYAHERGTSIEDQLLYAMTHLEETNQIMNDWEGNGSSAYQLGTYMVDGDSVPVVSYGRGYMRAGIVRLSVDFHGSIYGARTEVDLATLQ